MRRPAQAMRRGVVPGSVGALVAALLLSGCGSTHLAASTARADDPAPISSSTTTPPATTPSSGSSSSSPPAPDPTVAAFAAIRRLMAARARAVMSGNQGAFMATVDTKRPVFVAAQQVMFENLQDLPLTSMSFEVGTSGLTNAPEVHGAAVLSPEVVEHVFFAGTDERAVANQVDDTFVKRAGHWRLGADTVDLHASGNVTARPWDGPRLDVVTRGHLVVVADASDDGAATSVADTVESGLTFDAGILDVPVDDHLMVDATTSGSVSSFDNNDPAGAVTFPVEAGKDFEAGRLAGYRVKVNPDYIDQLTSNPTLLRHELVHYLMVQYTGVNPTWLTEGLAEYVSHQPGGLPTEYMTSEEYDRLMSRSQELTVSGLFGQDPNTDYPLAMACVTYLVNHGGVAKVETLMAAYAVHDDGPYEDQWTRQALRRVYGMTPSDVAHGAFDLLGALR